MSEIYVLFEERPRGKKRKEIGGGMFLKEETEAHLEIFLTKITSVYWLMRERVLEM